MQIELNEVLASKVETLATATGKDAHGVVEAAIETFAWTSATEAAGKTVLAASKSDEGAWVEEAFLSDAEFRKAPVSDAAE
ncbi:hypothetical protein TOTORO_02460 [Serratia phage vB_SmaS-Totoro]|nr:hypothetical protein TOTORO_02460 [Serratia phage vB_SmaS-Totoro]